MKQVPTRFHNISVREKEREKRERKGEKKEGINMCVGACI